MVLGSLHDKALRRGMLRARRDAAETIQQHGQGPLRMRLAHCSSTSNKREPATTKKEASSTEAEIDFSADGDAGGESEEAFMYATAHKGEEFKPNAARFTLLIDTGASENMLDDRLIPDLR
ncbi:unnamed protein product, partial [Ectocarpus fasciculatus]